MLSIFNLTIFAFWLISSLIDFFEYTYLWQLKEYRWDRFKDFLSTVEGKIFFTRYQFLWRSLIALLLFFWINDATIIIKSCLLSLFVIDFLWGLFKLFKHQIMRPTFTSKALLVLLLSLILEGGLFLIRKDWESLLILVMMRFFTVSIVVWLINQPSSLIKRLIIKLAAKKIKQYKNLKVIGITGSYGKSSVKTFLFHILQNKFKVIKTPYNINTEIGIAKLILKTDFKDIDIFICEMGAYSQGEIKAICNLVNPLIGILTAINEQHLSLFGNIKITQKTKYELLRALSKNGLAVVNSDNSFCREFLGDLNTNVETFGFHEEFKPTFLLKNVKTTEEGIYCTGLYNNLEGSVQVPIMGEHNFMNIAPCFLVGMFLGMTREEVRERCKSLKMPDGVMQLKKYGEALVIDDSYNSNPDGFKAALQVLQKYPSKRRRIIITRGMLELGVETNELHEQIGEEISLVAEELVIITRDFEESLTSGVGTKFKTEIKKIYDSNALLLYLKSLKNQHCVILMENRMPTNIHEELNKNSF